MTYNYIDQDSKHETRALCTATLYFQSDQQLVSPQNIKTLPDRQLIRIKTSIKFNYGI